MYQAKLFENQNTRDGKRKYGSSVHYHYVSPKSNSKEAYSGSKMVHSTMTEMLANVRLKFLQQLHTPFPLQKLKRIWWPTAVATTKIS